MTQRTTLAQAFLTRAGWGDAARKTVAGDASNRRYDRLTNADQHSTILMDAPPEKGEDVRPFVAIADHLARQGLSAPKILAQDTAHGFLLLEDLGDDLFARVLEGEPNLQRPLYEAACDVLSHLHRAPCPNLTPYDGAVMTDMAALAYDWYLLGATGTVDTDRAMSFKTQFRPMLEPLSQDRQVLIQRDYHAENLLWLPQREGVAKVGLLDFQDAMLGHPAYDLVSILQDARRDVPADLETEIKARYVAQNDLEPDDFDRAYALLGAQRNLRILGVFARLCLRDGKAHYVDLIPRVWAHVKTNLAHPALAPVAPLVLADLPVPTPTLLEHLKSQCATFPPQ